MMPRSLTLESLNEQIQYLDHSKEVQTGSNQSVAASLIESHEEITALKIGTQLLVEHISSSTPLGARSQVYLGQQKITVQRSKTKHFTHYSITVEDAPIGIIHPNNAGEGL